MRRNLLYRFISVSVCRCDWDNYQHTTASLCIFLFIQLVLSSSGVCQHICFFVCMSVYIVYNMQNAYNRPISSNVSSYYLWIHVQYSSLLCLSKSLCGCVISDSYKNKSVWKKGFWKASVCKQIQCKTGVEKFKICTDIYKIWGFAAVKFRITAFSLAWEY